MNNKKSKWEKARKVETFLKNKNIKTKAFK